MVIFIVFFRNRKRSLGFAWYVHRTFCFDLLLMNNRHYDDKLCRKLKILMSPLQRYQYLKNDENRRVIKLFLCTDVFSFYLPVLPVTLPIYVSCSLCILVPLLRIS